MFTNAHICSFSLTEFPNQKNERVIPKLLVLLEKSVQNKDIRSLEESGQFTFISHESELQGPENAAAHDAANAAANAAALVAAYAAVHVSIKAAGDTADYANDAQAPANAAVVNTVDVTASDIADSAADYPAVAFGLANTAANAATAADAATAATAATAGAADAADDADADADATSDATAFDFDVSATAGDAGDDLTAIDAEVLIDNVTADAAAATEGGAVVVAIRNVCYGSGTEYCLSRRTPYPLHLLQVSDDYVLKRHCLMFRFQFQFDL